ncbi:pimeloyl-ACP methyl ester carboxylesterase [Paenibacillus sp. DS2015]|uniref:alpha/beta fold hydrolase n=1 Tax=Paenibacillus sp. DS2015 TaxID=3373917 RepID=UPI003D1BCEE7
MKKDKIIILKDGRQLGYTEYGVSDGIPLFVFHGSPGSRLLFDDEDDAAIDLNVRIITVDRPGYGQSDMKQKRTFKDWSFDLSELADHLQIHLFGVAGISGGAPYAIACAEMIPEKLLNVFLVSTPSPINMLRYKKKMNKINRLGFTLSKHSPFLLELLFKAMTYQAKRVNDKQIIEAHRQGVKESVIETEMINDPWDINFSEIEFPIDLWHGEADDAAPIEGAVWISSQLAKAKLYRVKSGHSLFWNTSDRKLMYSEFLRSCKLTGTENNECSSRIDSDVEVFKASLLQDTQL